MESFGSLNGVMKLFQDRTLVTAGWVHYLAFDLLQASGFRRMHKSIVSITANAALPVLYIYAGPIWPVVILVAEMGKDQTIFCSKLLI